MFDGGGSFDPDGTIQLFEWDFDGDDAYDFVSVTGDTAFFTYAQPGTYTAGLRVTDNDGLTGTDTVSILVGPATTITSNVTTGVAGQTDFQFTANATPPAGGSIVSYAWDFRDGSVGTGSTVSHTFSNAGTLFVRVTVTDSLGNTTTQEIMVIVSQAGTPIAKASADTTEGDAPLTVNFSATGSTDLAKSVTLYEWAFSGGAVREDAETPSDMWTAQGTWTRTMLDSYSGDYCWADNAAGPYPVGVAMNLTSPSIDLRNMGTSPRLSFYSKHEIPWSDQGLCQISRDRGKTWTTLASFTGTQRIWQQRNFALNSYADADAILVRFKLESNNDGVVGDGWFIDDIEIRGTTEVYDFSSALTGDTSNIYTAPGLHGAALRITDNESKSATDTVQIAVKAPPTVAITAPQPNSQHGRSNVGFHADAVDLDGLIVLYEWDFDNDGTYDLTSQDSATASYTYPAGGTVTARVRVTDNQGNSATDQVSFSLLEGTPTISTLSADINLSGGNVAPFDVVFTGAATSTLSGITSYAWDFDGDGTNDWSNGGTAGRVEAWTTDNETGAGEAIDGKLNTFWEHTGQLIVPESLTVSLDSGAVWNIDRVKLFSTSRPPADFEILVSTTSPSSGFTSVGTFTRSDTLSWEEFTFASTPARYVKLLITSTHVDTGFRLYEFEVYAGIENVVSPPNAQAHHRYTSGGNFIARLQATNADGVSATDTIRVLVFDAGYPVVQASVVPPIGTVNAPMLFNGSATDNGAIALYEWDFENDGVFDWNSVGMGVIESFTAQYDTTTWAAENLLDGGTGRNFSWASPSGQTTNMEFVFSFGDSGTHTIDRVLLNNNAGESNTYYAKDFEIHVSTTAPDSGFSLAFAGTAAQITTDQFFDFTPVNATYVKLIFLNNYGGSYLESSEFTVFESGPDHNDLLRNLGKVYRTFSETSSATAALRVTDDENNQTTVLVDYAVAERFGSLATVWVAEDNNLAAYDAHGQVMKRVNGFDTPRDLVLDEPRGKLWVVDSDKDRLLRIDTAVPDGYNVNTAFTHHEVFRGMDNPYTLTLDPTDGSVWVGARNSDNIAHVPADLLNGAPVTVTATSPANGPGGIDTHLVGTTSSVVGQLGNGAQIGAGGFVLLPHNLFDGLGDFTFEAWFSHSFTHDGTVLSVAAASTDNMLLIFLATVTSIQVRVNNQLSTFTVPDMSVGRHHIALTRSGTDLTLLLDGTAIGTVATTSALLIADPGGSLLGQEQGSVQGNFDGNKQLDGIVDDVRLWDVARSEAQVLAAMNAELAGNESNLIGYWKLNTYNNAAPVTRIIGFNNINDVELDPARGRLWIADESASTVYGLDTDVADGYDITSGSGSHVAVSGFNTLRTVAVDPDTGAVWVGSSDLFKLDAGIADGYTIASSTGSHEMIPLNWDPYYLGRSDVNGMLWASDAAMRGVSRLSLPDGTEHSRTMLPKDEPHNFGAHPLDGRVWAVDYEDFQLYQFAPAGNLIQSVTTGNSSPFRPYAVAVDSGVTGLNAPQVSATAVPSGKASESYDFSGLASDNGTIVRYDWDFEGDGIYDFTSPTSPDTSFAYDTPGNYVPVLRVIDDEGLAGYGVADAVNVGALEVIPRVTPATPAARASVVFDATIRGPELGIVEYAWDINGDGVIDRTQSNSATYTNDFDFEGVYVVTLTVTTASGAIATGAITVNVLQGPPEARVIVNPTSGKAPLLVNLKNNGSHAAAGGSIVLYEWDYDNDGIFDWFSNTGGNVSHYYLEPGIYHPTLRVTDNLGQQDTGAATLDVQREGPNVVASADATEGNAPFTVNFDGSDSSATNGASLLSFDWNFADGNIDTGSTVAHEFTAARSTPYLVTLTVTDSNGDTGTAQVPIQVKAAGSPTAVAGADVATGAIPLQVSLTGAASSDPDGTIVLYEWDFDGNGTYDYSSPSTGNTERLYTKGGVFQATLRVTDDAGLSDTDRVAIRVGIPPVSRPGVYPGEGEVPFKPQFRTHGTDEDGTLVLFQWDFDGNGTVDWTNVVPNTPGFTGGTFGNDSNPPFSYLLEGDYDATLRVVDNDGLDHSASVPVTVTATSPTAEAFVAPDNGVNPVTVTLVGRGKKIGGTLALFEWDYESDGVYDFSSTSTGTTTHTYTDPGVHQATFRVTDNSGKDATAPVFINVRAPGAPQAIGSATPSQGLVYLAVSFTGAGIDADGTIQLYEWDFDGDGTFDFSSATSAATTFTYSQPGFYPAQLRVTDNDGLQGTDVVGITAGAGISAEVVSDAFDPTVGETTTILSAISGDTTFSLLIYNDAGHVVRTLVDAEDRPTGLYQDVWDGRNDEGAIVPQAIYRFIIRYLLNGEEEVLDLSNTRSLAEGALSFNYPNTFSPFASPLTMEFNLPAAAELTIYISNVQGAPVRIKTIMLREPSPSGSYVIPWDGTNDQGALAGAGQYRLGVFAYDLPDNAIIVRSRPQITNVSALPNAYSPAQNPYEESAETLTIAYRLSKQADVTVVIQDSQGTVIRTIDIEDAAAGDHSTTWNGRLGNGELPFPGAYRAGVQATDAAGNTSLRFFAPFRVFY